ncbi:MAG: alpha/beta hydrolase family protein, partial [Planctomycetota bacterium]
IPLEMTRASGFPPLPAELRDRLAGVWEGALSIGAIELRLVFHLQAGGNGHLGGSMDSPDQGAKDIAVTRTDFLEDGRVRICIGSVGGAFEASLEERGDFLAGTFRQGGQELPLTLHRVAAPTRVNRPQTPKPPFPYRQEEVSYENKAGGVTLAGTLTLPPGEGPFPAALLITGSGAQDRDETIFQHHPFLVIADHLTRAGVAVLRVDDRGVGGSSRGPEGATTADFAGDVRAGVAFLRGRRTIDPARIGLIGHSEGGIIAPMVASEDKDLAFVVLLAGTGLPGGEILEMQSALIARASGGEEKSIAANRKIQKQLFSILADESLSPDAARERMRKAFLASPDLPEGKEGESVIRRQLAMLESPWMRFFIRLDPAPYLEKVKCPVLAMNGTLDLQVPCKEDLEAIGKALEKGGNPDFTLKKLPGLNHLFQHAETGLVTEYGHIEETFSEEALDLMTAWILERVRKRGS